MNEGVLPLPLFEDNIGIFVIGSFLYGVYLVLFLISTFVLHLQRGKIIEGRSSGSLGTNIYITLGYLIFFFTTLNWALVWVTYSGVTPGATNHPTSDQDQYNPQRSVIMFIQEETGNLVIFLADVVMMYRLYLVWNRKKMVAFLGGLVAAVDLALTIVVLIQYTRTGRIWQREPEVLGVITLLVNIITTTLISYRIWDKCKITRALGGRRIVTRGILIIVESAAMQTIWILLFLIFHFVNYPISHLFLYGAPGVAGIATTLVNVCVGLGWASQEEGRATRSSSVHA